MSIFNPKQQTVAKARSKRAWVLTLLSIMTILMGLWGTPQVEAAEPTESEDGPYLVASSQPTTIVVVPLQYGVMPDRSNGQQITASPSCEATQRPGLRMLSNGDFLAFWPNCYSRFKRNAEGGFNEVDLGQRPSGWSISSPAADLNGDGRDDLLLSRRVSPSGYTDYQYKVALGQADGSFDFDSDSEPTTLVQNQWGAHITLGDVNGDGNADLVYHSFAHGGQFTTQIYMLAGNGDGTFANVANKQLVVTAPSGVSSTRPLLADFNGNKQTDIFLPPDDDTHDMGQAYIALNNNSNNFTVEQSIDFDPKIESRRPDTFSASALTCDVDLDGKLDLIAYSNDLPANTGSLSIHLGDGMGSFEQDGHVLREGSNPQPSLGCFSPQLAIQQLDQNTQVVKGGILVNAEATFEVPEGFAGYQWAKIKTINLGRQLPSLPNSQNQVTLYQIHPAPENTQLYTALFQRLLQEYGNQTPDPQINCVGFDRIGGSPNSIFDRLAAPSQLDSNRQVKNLSQPTVPLSAYSYTGQNVVIAILDAFRSDGATHWVDVPVVDFNQISVSPPLINSGGDGNKDIHGDLIISIVRETAPDAVILPVRILNDDAVGDIATLIKGLTEVIKAKSESNSQKKWVVNMSFGLNALPTDGCGIQTVEQLLQQAEEKENITFIAAAGNDGQNGQPLVDHPHNSHYPGNSEDVISVAASYSNGTPASYSRGGEVMAFGGDQGDEMSVEIPVVEDGVVSYLQKQVTGTSFSAPKVTRLATHLLSCNPDLTPNQIRDLIDANPNNINDLINVEQILTNAGCPTVGATAVAPWQENANGNLRTDISWHYAMGYHFTPQVDGEVTELGGLFDGTKTVRLFNKQTGQLLAETSVTAANDWGYSAIDPVSVEKDVTYTVAVYLARAGGSRRSGINPFPQTYGDIRIEGTTYAYTGWNANARPTNTYTRAMLGQADIKFVANSEPTTNRASRAKSPTSSLANFEATIATTGDQVLIKWANTSQSDTKSFNLYRSSNINAIEALLNEDFTLLQSVASNQKMTYQWKDNDIKIAESYHYWLEEIDANGFATWHGPVTVTLKTPTPSR